MLYVVYCRFGCELTFIEQLRLKGIKAYCPRQLSEERHGGEWQRVERMLFSGYVFVEKDGISAEDWHVIAACHGFVRFLSLCSLSPTEDEYIRALCNEDECIDVSRGYITDGTLHITEGFLKKLEHKIIKYNRRGRRATADVTMYGKHYKVVLSVIIEPPAKA